MHFWRRTVAIAKFHWTLKQPTQSRHLLPRSAMCSQSLHRTQCLKSNETSSLRLVPAGPASLNLQGGSGMARTRWHGRSWHGTARKNLARNRLGTSWHVKIWHGTWSAHGSNHGSTHGTNPWVEPMGRPMGQTHGSNPWFETIWSNPWIEYGPNPWKYAANMQLYATMREF